MFNIRKDLDLEKLQDETKENLIEVFLQIENNDGEFEPRDFKLLLELYNSLKIKSAEDDDKEYPIETGLDEFYFDAWVRAYGREMNCYDKDYCQESYNCEIDWRDIAITKSMLAMLARRQAKDSAMRCKDMQEYAKEHMEAKA